MIEFQIGWLLIAAYGGIVTWAVINDCISFRIPNAASIALVLLFPVWLALNWPVSGAWTHVGLHLAVGIGMLVVGFVLFAVRAFGAGDAKLLASVALWAGPEHVLDLVLATAIVGGAFSMVIIVARPLAERFLLEYRLRSLGALLFGNQRTVPDDPDTTDGHVGPASGASRGVAFKRPIPYGVAIGAGAALVAYGLLTTSGAA